MLGSKDREDDTLSTKRRRRKIIVLKQRQGRSLDLTIKESVALQNLGLKFKELKSPKADEILSTKSTKKRTIFLKRIDPKNKSVDGDAAP